MERLFLHVASIKCRRNPPKSAAAVRYDRSQDGSNYGS
jgi:hypothetical protein